jgi:hypothetical protein
MTKQTIEYHGPPLGRVHATLHEESAQLYRLLETSGEISRLGTLDHLGSIRHAFPGAHHPRWEYTVSILHLIDRCKEIQGVHVSANVLVESDVVFSSGRELLWTWALLMNLGHLHGTFAVERALASELVDRPRLVRECLDAVPTTRIRQWAADEVLRKLNVYRVFQLLGVLRLQWMAEAEGWSEDDLRRYSAALGAYVRPTARMSKIPRLRSLYFNIRRLAYLALDTHYTPALVPLRLDRVLTDPLEFARLLLWERQQREDPFAGIEQQLTRDVYLGPAVLREIAAREEPLRRLIATSLDKRGLRRTVEDMAANRLQQEVVPVPTQTVLRIAAWISPPLDRVVLEPPDTLTEQRRTDAALARRRSTAMGVWWPMAASNQWVLQLHADPDDYVSKGRVFEHGFEEATRLYARAETRWASETVNDEVLHAALFDGIAADIVIAALNLVCTGQYRWEWAAGSGWRARILRRSRARSRLEEQLASDRFAGSRRTWVVHADCSVVAYAPDGVKQLAELDGVMIEASPSRGVEVTLVEVKRQRRSALGAARNALDSKARRLEIAPYVSTGEGSASDGNLGIAWKTLRMRRR